MTASWDILCPCDCIHTHGWLKQTVAAVNGETHKEGQLQWNKAWGHELSMDWKIWRLLSWNWFLISIINTTVLFFFFFLPVVTERFCWCFRSLVLCFLSLSVLLMLSLTPWLWGLTSALFIWIFYILDPRRQYTVGINVCCFLGWFFLTPVTYWESMRVCSYALKQAAKTWDNSFNRNLNIFSKNFFFFFRSKLNLILNLSDVLCFKCIFPHVWKSEVRSSSADEHHATALDVSDVELFWRYHHQALVFFHIPQMSQTRCA